MLNFFQNLFKSTKSSNSDVLKHANLMNMPSLVMREILKNADMESILKLRKVCRDLREFIDDIADLDICQISIRSSNMGVNLAIYSPGRNVKVEYSQVRRGCCMKSKSMFYKGFTREKKKFIRNGKCLDIFFNDLAVIMKFQRSTVEKFSINFGEMNSYFRGFTKKLRDVLESRNLLIKTEQFHVKCSSVHPIMCSLPFIDSDSLKSIEIQSAWHDPFYGGNSDAYLEIEDVVNLEQWKKATKLKIYDFCISKEYFENFNNASDVNITLEVVKLGYLMHWKENFLNHPHIQKVSIKCHGFPDQDGFDAFFGAYRNENQLDFIKTDCWFKTLDLGYYIRVVWFKNSIFHILRTTESPKNAYGLVHGA